jgi:TM2 domain-containing membrane protein YozV
MDEIRYKVRRADVIEMHIVLLLSIAGGMLGADRAYKGQIGLAFLKAITLGGLFLWFIVDIWSSAVGAKRAWHRYYKYLGKEAQKSEI